MGYNPRYLKYCESNGKTPEQQMADDKIQWPGGCMCGFTFWIRDKWMEFHKEVIPDEGSFFVTAYHKEFDEWLNKPL